MMRIKKTINSSPSVGSATMPGRRSNNEDACLTKSGERWALIAVADGMGGSTAGEVAAQTAIGSLDSLTQWLGKLNQPPAVSELRSRMRQAVRRAGDLIFAQARDDPSLHGMGTTLILAVIVDRQAVIAHVGDSRAYLYSNGQITRLTRDHSLMEERPEDWDGLSEQVGRALTRSLGDEPWVCPEITPPWAADDSEDTWHGLAPESSTEDRERPPHAGTLPLRDGDLLLLCSDGLSGVIAEQQMLPFLTASFDLESLAQTMIQAAFDAGSQDNISCCLAGVGPPWTAADGRKKKTNPPKKRHRTPQTASPQKSAKVRRQKAISVLLTGGLVTATLLFVSAMFLARDQLGRFPSLSELVSPIFATSPQTGSRREEHIIHITPQNWLRAEPPTDSVENPDSASVVGVTPKSQAEHPTGSEQSSIPEEPRESEHHREPESDPPEAESDSDHPPSPPQPDHDAAEPQDPPAEDPS